MVLQAWVVCELREGLEKILDHISEHLADRLVVALLLPN